MLTNAPSTINAVNQSSEAMPVVIVKIQVSRLLGDQQDETVLTTVAPITQDIELIFSKQGEVDEHGQVHISSSSLPLSSLAVRRSNARPLSNRMKRGKRPTSKRGENFLYNYFNTLVLYTLADSLFHDLQFMLINVATHAAGVLLRGANLNHLPLDKAAFAVRGM
jgi:hypothetical protein